MNHREKDGKDGKATYLARAAVMNREGKQMYVTVGARLMSCSAAHHAGA